MNPVNIQFNHGIGDCVYFAHQLPLYTRRGYHFQIQCSPGKRFLFADCDSVVYAQLGSDVPSHPWLESGRIEEIDPDLYFLINKAGRNLSLPPMPDIGTVNQQLWEEYCAVDLNLTRHLSPADRSIISYRFQDLPRPVVLLHTSGSSLRGAKDIDDRILTETCTRIVQQLKGSVVTLNWDRDLNINLPGVFPMRTLFRDPLKIPQVIAMFESADLLVGIDSGPAHLARFTNLPVIFVWKNHHPAAFSLPRNNNIHLVPRRPESSLNRHFRHIYHLIECDEPVISTDTIYQNIARFFQDSAFFPENKGIDMQVQHLLSPRTVPETFANGMTIFYDFLLKRPTPFTLIETGTMGFCEEWKRTGCSTFLLSLLTLHHPGKLYSVDTDGAKCRAAERNLRHFQDTVRIFQNDSVTMLSSFDRPIDAVYLDSMNLRSDNIAAHCLKEAKAADGILVKGGLIAINECKFTDDGWQNRGAQAAPWLLEQQYELIHSDGISIFRKPR